MRSTCIRLSLQLGTLVAGLILLPAAGRACIEDACAFQIDQTKIRPDLWQEPCDKLSVTALDQSHYGADVKAPVHFVRGVCIFERLSRKLSPFASDFGRSTMTPIESGIDELQKAQSTAMLLAQRATAALFEGLLHCRQLDAIAAGAKASMERRCFHRSAAKESLGVVDLAGFTLRYEEGDFTAPRVDTTRFTQVIDEMIGCQVKHLHARETASCGMLLSPSDQELDQLVDTAASDVLPRYFGADAQQEGETQSVAPIEAMMARRLREARAAAEGSKGAFDVLRRNNAQVVANKDQLASKLCDGDKASCLPAAVAELYAAYNAAIKTAVTYAAFVKQSIAGLLLDENKQDVGKRVQENLADAAEQASQLAALRPALETLRNDLTRLSVDSQGTATMREACRLLFCDLYDRGHAEWLRNACISVDPSQPRERLASSNPFCQTDPARQLLVGVGNGSATATTVCREAGFDPMLVDCSKPAAN